MPFSPAFEKHHLFERLRRLRTNPVAAYGTAVGVVAVAILIRWAVSGSMVEGLPFITYYPAIIVATLIGGFWPGVLTLILSTLTAWYFFIPPEFGWHLGHRELVSLLLFVALGGVNVAIITLLNSAVERVLTQEQNVRVLIESAPNGIIVVDGRGDILLVNASSETLFGYQRSELLGKNIEVLVPARQADTHFILRKLYQQAPTTRLMGAGRDLSGKRKDGSEFPVEIGLNPIRRNGDIAVLATVIDITERKRAQDNQKLIIRELQHRTQNLFAVFRAIAERSIEEGRTAAEIKHVLNGRLQALAQAYAMLADAKWEGASLADILVRELAGFSGRLNISGCDIVLTPTAAQQFALIVHELGTNALKYGALSTPEGHVSIEGKINRHEGEETFSFVWKETGGPTPIQPTRRGFGSVIILDSAKQFASDIVLDYPPQGLSYTLTLHLSEIEAVAKREGKATAH